MREQWFVLAGVKGSWREPIAYDPRNLDTIYLRRQGGRQLETCHLLPASKTYLGCNWYEVVDHFCEVDFARNDAKPSQQQAKAALNAYIDQVKASADRQTASAQDGQTKHSRVKEIRRNRKAEREYEQDLNAWNQTQNNLVEEANGQVIPIPTVAQPSTDDDSYVPPHRPIDKLRKSLMRKLNNDPQ